MMGSTHALSGLCAGLWVAPLVGVDGLAGTVVFAGLVAGFALFPDLDHDHSSASRFLGSVTWLLAQLVQAMSRGVYQLTKGPRDEACSGEHRHLTHTLCWAIGSGLLAGWGGERSPWVVVGLLALGVLLAADRLGDWVLVVVGVAGFVWWGAQHGDATTVPSISATLTGLHGTVGVAVAVGAVVHDLGDMLTEHGVPLLWPLPILGETWYELRPPAWLRFRTGKGGEKAVVVLLVAGIGWFGWLHLEPRLPDQPDTPTSGSSGLIGGSGAGGDTGRARRSAAHVDRRARPASLVLTKEPRTTIVHPGPAPCRVVDPDAPHLRAPSAARARERTVWTVNRPRAVDHLDTLISRTNLTAVVPQLHGLIGRRVERCAALRTDTTAVRCRSTGGSETE